MKLGMLELLSNATMERDHTEFVLGDTYDIKASIVLVIATFLGTLCMGIISVDNLNLYLRVIQVFAIVALLASGLFSILVLRLRDYKLEGNPKTIRGLARQTNW